MKLKEFKAEKELRKRERNKKKLALLLPCASAIMFLLATMYHSFAIYRLKSETTIINTTVGTISSADVKILAVYLEESPYTEGLPNLPTDKAFDRIVCKYNGQEVSGVTGSWDGNGLTISGVKQQMNCSVYFKNTLFLNEKILADNGTKAVIDAKPTPNFSVGAVSTLVYNQLTASSKSITNYGGKHTISISHSAQSNYETTNGMYATKSNAYSNGDNFGNFNSQHDNDGTSYYYRGAIENNFVKFGKNASGEDLWWRIIRINGDGTIRLIHNGPSAVQTGITTQTSKNYFNYAESAVRYNAHVGLMYGTANSGTYAAEHVGSYYSTADQSIYKASVMYYLNLWYEATFGSANTANGGPTSAGRIATNQIFCGDRNIANNSSHTGLGKIYTDYGAYVRLISNKQPSLQCVNKTTAANKSSGVATTADQYGISGTGNGRLTYPVGLITADEVALAGGVNGHNNADYWLFTGQDHWTMTPHYFNGNAAVFFVHSLGYLNSYYTYGAIGVRPVINLKSDTEIQLTGTGAPGTSTNPYIVKLP